MRVGILCYPSHGGSGVVATELGKYLAGRGHEVHFINYQQPFRLQGFNPCIYYHEVELSSYPLFKYPPYTLALVNKVAAVTREAGLNIIHAHYAIPHSLCAYLAREMVGRDKVKIITTLHGTDITLVGMSPALSRVAVFSLEQSDAVTAVSHYLNNAMRETFSLSREIVTIHNFIDTDTFRRLEVPGIRSVFARQNEKIVTHISNFRAVKRAPMAVEIFARLAERVPARLVLAGAGPELPVACDRARELGVSDRVISLGEQDSVVEILSASDLLLLPSSQESFGLVALEAMACQVPVVASRVGGLPELVADGETGFLLEPDDLEGMAIAAATVLLDDDRRQQLGRAARQRALELFHPDVVVPRYEQLYRSLLR